MIEQKIRLQKKKLIIEIVLEYVLALFMLFLFPYILLYMSNTMIGDNTGLDSIGQALGVAIILRLFKAHNPLTTTALTEIPVSRSIADFILINGKVKSIIYIILIFIPIIISLSTIFEVQISNFMYDMKYNSSTSAYTVKKEDYKSTKDFYNELKKRDLLYSDETKILEDKLNNPNVGIYYISKRGALRKYREPLSYVLDLDYECLFKILRKSEYEKILSKYFSLPDVPQYRYYTECLHFFKKIPLDKVYLDFKYQLKQRSNIKIELYSSIPKELKAVAYFSRLKESDFSKLTSFLEEKFGV